MRDNQYLAWTSFALFVINIGIILLFLLFASANANPGFLLLVVGAFSLIGTIMGFLSFRAPQAKIGGIGGLVLLLLVMFLIPIRSETMVTPPQPVESFQEPTGYTGIAEIDTIIDTFLAGNAQEQLQLFEFSTLGCTHAEGLGGPPKCRQGEEEGTEVEVFPFLGPEGHHMRQSEADEWKGLQVSDVYAVYRVSDQVYSDEAYPAGEYAIVFLFESGGESATAHVRNGKIVRLDTGFEDPAEIDLERLASEVILGPQR